MSEDDELRALVRAIGPDKPAAHTQLARFLRSLEGDFDEDHGWCCPDRLIEIAETERRLIGVRDPALPEVEAFPLPQPGHAPGSTIAKPILNGEQA